MYILKKFNKLCIYVNETYKWKFYNKCHLQLHIFVKFNINFKSNIYKFSIILFIIIKNMVNFFNFFKYYIKLI